VAWPAAAAAAFVLTLGACIVALVVAVMNILNDGGLGPSN
jgi:hypothetical protein